MSLRHVPGCTEDTAKYEAEKAAWLAQWPKYCPACSGYGGHYYSENVGEITAPVMMSGVDPCDTCVGQGVCPRCGERSWETESEGFGVDPMTCQHCGWEEAKPDGMPQPPECFCWLHETYEGEG